MNKEFSNQIIQKLFSQFCSLSNSLIENYEMTREDEIIELNSLENHQGLSSILYSLSMLSVNCAPNLIRALIEWRSLSLKKEHSQIQSSHSSNLDLSNEKESPKQLQTSSPANKKTEKRKNISIYHNKKQQIKLFKEAIFIIACARILEKQEDQFNPPHLIRNQFTTILLNTLDSLESEVSENIPEQTLFDKNISFIQNFFGYAFGLLSRTKLPIFVQATLQRTQLKHAQPKARFKPLQYIILELDSQEKIDNSSKFIEIILENLNNSKTNAQKDLLSCISNPFKKVALFSRAQNLRFVNWDQKLEELIQKTKSLIKKPNPKTNEIVSLITALYCCSSPDFFAKSIQNLLDILFRVFNSKHGKEISISCFLLFFEVQFGKYSNIQVESIMERALVIFSTIALSVKNPYYLFLPLISNSISKMILIISNWDLFFSMNKIVMSFLLNDKMEFTLIGIKSLALISQKHYINHQDTMIFNSQHSFSQELKIIIQKTMNDLDKQIGGISRIVQTRFPDEFPNEKRKSIEILTECIKCTPYFFPFSKNLFTLLSKYTQHLDAELSKHSFESIKKIIQNHPKYRFKICIEFANYILTIPDNQEDFILDSLQKFEELLDFWQQISSKETVEIETKFFDQIEAVFLVFLCNSFPKVRSKSFNILKKIRNLSSFLSSQFLQLQKDEIDSLDTQRVIDIFEEGWNEVITTNLIHPIKITSIDELISNQSYSIFSIDKMISDPEVSDIWIFYFCRLAKILAKISPEITYLSFKETISKILSINSESTQFSKTSDEFHIYITHWTNYAMFATSVAGTKKDDQTGLTKTLFQFLVPLLQSHSDDIRKSAVMALSQTNEESIPDLWEEIDVILKYLLFEKEKAKGIIQTNRIISQIFAVIRSVVNGVGEEYFQNNAEFFKKIEEKIQIFIDYASSAENIDNPRLQLLRYNVAILIQKYIQVLSNFRKELKKEQRYLLFELFGNYCGFGNQENYEKMKQKFNKIIEEKIKESFIEKHKNIFNEENRSVEYVLLQAMASLLIGDFFSENCEQLDGEIFKWIFSLLTSENDYVQSIGRISITNFFKHNSKALLSVYIDQVFCGNSQKTISAFAIALTEMIIRNDLEIPIPISLHLILAKIGSPDRLVRQHIVELFEFFISKTFGESGVRKFPTIHSNLCSTNETLVKMQIDLSNLFVSKFPELSFVMVEEICFRYTTIIKKIEEKLLDFHDAQNAKDSILRYLIPWIQKIEISNNEEKFNNIIEKLFEITKNIEGNNSTFIQNIWGSIAKNPKNLMFIIDYLLKEGIKNLKDENYFNISKRIILYIYRNCGSQVIDILIQEIDIFNEENELEKNKKQISKLNLNKKNENEIDKEFESNMKQNEEIEIYRREIPIIFLSELIPEVGKKMVEKLAVILHSTFSILDHLHPTIYQNAKLVLLNMIITLILNEKEYINSEKIEIAHDLVERITSNQEKPLFIREDICENKLYLQSEIELEDYITQFVELFELLDANIKEKWCLEAFKWSTKLDKYGKVLTQHNLHICARSHQIYRALLSKLKKKELNEMIDILYLTFSPSLSLEKLIWFIVEILNTLKIMATKVQSLKDFPSLFWTTIALLQTDNDKILLFVMQLVERIIDIGFSDEETMNKLISSLPKQWDFPFDGIQPLILKGMYFPRTEDIALKILTKMTTFPKNEIISKNSNQFLSNFLGLLPLLSKSLQENTLIKISTTIENLRSSSSLYGFKEIEEILEKFENNEFKNNEEFLLNLKTPFSKAFFPQEIAFTFNFLLHALGSFSNQYRNEYFEILKILLSTIDISQNEFLESVDPQLISSLTSFSSQQDLEKVMDILRVITGQSSLEGLILSSDDEQKIDGFLQFAKEKEFRTIKALKSIAKKRVPFTNDIFSFEKDGLSSNVVHIEKKKMENLKKFSFITKFSSLSNTQFPINWSNERNLESSSDNDENINDQADDDRYNLDFQTKNESNSDSDLDTNLEFANFQDMMQTELTSPFHSKRNNHKKDDELPSRKKGVGKSSDEISNRKRFPSQIDQKNSDNFLDQKNIHDFSGNTLKIPSLSNTEVSEKSQEENVMQDNFNLSSDEEIFQFGDQMNLMSNSIDLRQKFIESMNQNEDQKSGEETEDNDKTDSLGGDEMSDDNF